MTVNVNQSGTIGAVPVGALDPSFKVYSNYRVIEIGDRIAEDRSLYIRIRYVDAFDLVYYAYALIEAVPSGQSDF